MVKFKTGSVYAPQLGKNKNRAHILRHVNLKVFFTNMHVWEIKYNLLTMLFNFKVPGFECRLEIRTYFFGVPNMLVFVRHPSHWWTKDLGSCMRRSLYS